MANTKISALTASTTPLAGTEVLPIVQSSTTKQVSVANLTAGRAVSAASLALTTSPLPTTSGGTALTSFTANGIVYASSSSALATSSTLNFTNGNLGVDATPASWSWPTGATGIIQIREGGALSGYNATTYLSNNWYYNAGEKFIANGYATRYEQTTGKHTWYVSNASNAGGAGASVTWTTLGGWGTNGDFTLNGGNVVPATAAKGVNFTANTPAAGKTSQLLNWYEEGTWTPSTAFATFVGAASSSGTYTRVGRQVTVNGTLTGATSVTVGASGILTTSLPFNASYDAIGSMAASTNTASGVVRVTGPYVVAVTTIASVTSITFTATYFV